MHIKRCRWASTDMQTKQLLLSTNWHANRTFPAEHHTDRHILMWFPGCAGAHLCKVVEADLAVHRWACEAGRGVAGRRGCGQVHDLGGERHNYNWYRYRYRYHHCYHYHHLYWHPFTGVKFMTWEVSFTTLIDTVTITILITLTVTALQVTSAWLGRWTLHHSLSCLYKLLFCICVASCTDRKDCVVLLAFQVMSLHEQQSRHKRTKYPKKVKKISVHEVSTRT